MFPDRLVSFQVPTNRENKPSIFTAPHICSQVTSLCRQLFFIQMKMIQSFPKTHGLKEVNLLISMDH